MEGTARVKLEALAGCLLCDNIAIGECTCGRYGTVYPLGGVDLGIKHSVSDVGGFLGYRMIGFINILNNVGISFDSDDFTLTNGDLLMLRVWYGSRKNVIKVGRLNDIILGGSVYASYLASDLVDRERLLSKMVMYKGDDSFPVEGGYIHE